MSRKDPDKRKQEILQAALRASEKSNYMDVTKKQIASMIDVHMSLINFYFGTMDKLRKEIMRSAVKQQCLKVIAQGVVRNDRHALKAPLDVRVKALMMFK